MRGEVFGSPGHMPPEQLHGAELTPATDVFAVGVLLIEAWTGHPPFRRATVQASERALFNVPLPVDQQVPELAPLSALIASCVALDARDRPAAAEQVARSLREFHKTEDSGDIARRLGDRVRQARGRVRTGSWQVGELGLDERSGSTNVPSGATSEENGCPAPSTASAPATRTFAARDDLEIWTRRLSSAPTGPSEPPDSGPTASVSGANAPSTGRAPAAESARRKSGVASSRWSRPPGPPSGLALLVLSAVSFVAIAFAAAPRLGTLSGGSTARLPRATSAATLEPTTVSQPGQLPAASAPLNGDVTPPRPSARPVSVPPAREQSRAKNPAPPSAEPEQFGLLKITADPPAQIEVSGSHVQTSGRSPMLIRK